MLEFAGKLRRENGVVVGLDGGGRRENGRRKGHILIKESCVCVCVCAICAGNKG